MFDSPSELKTAVGQSLGHSDWLEIDQARIDKFADATGDHQWQVVGLGPRVLRMETAAIALVARCVIRDRWM